MIFFQNVLRSFLRIQTFLIYHDDDTETTQFNILHQNT